jgi:hypothetical protein
MSSKSLDRAIVYTRRKYSHQSIGWIYSPPGGGLCPIDEATWRNIAGLFVRTPNGVLWLHFRRWSRKRLS